MSPDLHRPHAAPHELPLLSQRRGGGASRGSVADGGLRLDPTPAPEAVIERLQELPGIGEWTAQYIALRALRWPDAFPCGDLAIRKALDMRTAREVLTAAEPWRPWRAYAAMYLWNSLDGC